MPGDSILRSTSLAAYNFIKENGLLSKKKWEIYDELFASKGNLTHGELSMLIESKYETVYNGKPRKFYRNNIVTRLGELRDLGVIAETGKRKCENSGRLCITWDVTDRLPIKLDKPKRVKCKACNGKGYHETTQLKMGV